MLQDLRNMFMHLARRWSGQLPSARQTDLRGKHAIVTGASPGSLGFETARTLARWGAQVTITTRNQSDAAAAQLNAELPAQNPVRGMNLDLTSSASIRDFTDHFIASHQRLDILINNAGIHLDLTKQWKEPQLIDDKDEIHWRINYLGTFQLTHRLLPLLLQTARQGGDARVVNVVSHLHRRGRNQELLGGTARPYNSWEAYGNSKLALVHHAFEIERRFGPEGLHGFAVHPGSIHSNISDKGLASSPLLQQLRRLFNPLEGWFLLTPEQGCQTQVACATDPHFPGGHYYERCQKAPHSSEADDATTAALLWQQTEQACQLEQNLPRNTETS